MSFIMENIFIKYNLVEESEINSNATHKIHCRKIDSFCKYPTLNISRETRSQNFYKVILI